jgi:hypothetical protein
MFPLKDFLARYGESAVEDCNVVLERAESIGDERMRFVLHAWPWWSPPQPKDPEARGELTIELRGIALSEYRLWWRSLQIIDISVRNSGHALRELGHWVDIYGASPISDPELFFAEFHDLCVSLWAAQSPIFYTQRLTVADFAATVASNSYLLLKAPAEIAEGARRLLDARGVKYSWLPQGKPRHGDFNHLVEVEIGEHWFVCREAVVSASPSPEDVARSS